MKPAAKGEEKRSSKLADEGDRRSQLLLEKERMIQQAIATGELTFPQLVQVKSWLTKSGPDADAWNALGARHYDRALEVFRAHNGGPETAVAIFGRSATGIYLTPTGRFKYMVTERAIRFDWSEAHRLLYRIDALAEQAREWWPQTPTKTDHPADAGTHASPNPADPTTESAPTPGRSRWQTRTETRAEDRRAVERSPHLDRAYALLTAVFAAVERENERHLDDPHLNPDQPSTSYRSKLVLLTGELSRAELLLLFAAQRNAETLYGRGMLLGAWGVALGCLVMGAACILGRVPAEYVVALPAGALGAVVSVLQRMTSGNMELDFHAGSRMLTIYGAMRPVIGAVFGMAVFAAIAGGLLPSIDVSTDAPLAFYAIVGFVAGFNERFAQDMLVGSARRLASQVEAEARNVTSTSARDRLALVALRGNDNTTT